MKRAGVQQRAPLRRIIIYTPLGASGNGAPQIQRRRNTRIGRYTQTKAAVRKGAICACVVAGVGCIATRDGGPARVHQNSRPSARPLAAHGGEGGGYQLIHRHADQHLGVFSAIGSLTKPNKSRLLLGKGRGGEDVDSVGVCKAPHPRHISTPCTSWRRPAHACNVRKVARMGHGASAAGVAHLSLGVWCRR